VEKIALCSRDMGTARDEHARQADTQGIQNDTDLMDPSVDAGPRMTGHGAIPDVEDGFGSAGPTASDLAYGSYVQVTASVLNVRAQPSTSAPKVGKLTRGTKVEVRGRDGDWVAVSYAGGTGYVHGNYVVPIDTRPSAEASAEVMQMFREVNGEEGRGAPPSPEASAEVMQMFREVNGEPGRGRPPSAESSAEVMNDFREVNGDIGRGRPPSAESSAEVMKDFWEVNGGPPVKKDILDDLE
jgi:hypothetical protein